MLPGPAWPHSSFESSEGCGSTGGRQMERYTPSSRLQHQNLKLPLKMTMSHNQRALVGLICCSFLLCASATDVDYACYSGSALYERYASSKDSLLPLSRCHRLLIRSRLLCRIPTVCNRQLKPKSLRDPTVDGSTDNWSVKKRNF